MGALSANADERDGRYPDDLFSKATIEELRRWGIRQQLAGLSGDIPETVHRAEAGLLLDTNVSSWIYWPGFRTDDPAELAIIWDRKGGLASNARRIDGNAVGFADGSQRLIPLPEWPGFVQRQEALRARILAGRNQSPNPGPVSPQK